MNKLWRRVFQPMVVVFCAVLMGSDASASATSITVEATRVEVGSVIVLRGKGFTSGAAERPKVTFEGIFHPAHEKAPARRIAAFTVEGHFEHAERVSVPIDESFRARFNGEHGAWFGKVRLALSQAGGGYRVFDARRVNFEVFPQNLQALANKVKASGLVPTVNGIMVWGLVFLLPLLLGGFCYKRAGLGFIWSATLAAILGVILYALQPKLTVIVNDLTSMPGLIEVGLMAVSALLVLLLVMAPFAGIATLVERRVSGRMQKRIGANRVGPQGLLQWVADAVKLLLKEDIVPTNADPILFRAAPYLVFMGVYLTFAALPFTTSLVVADFNLGILYLIGVTAVVVVGLLMAGWASNNKWALLGGMRSAAQIVSYEIPTALALLAVVVASGTASTQAIIASQGGAPWNWFLFHSPLHFTAFFLYFTSALAEGNRTPFDLPEAESELVSGYNTEYSGMRFAFFFLGEFANIYVMSAIAVIAFLGGWRIPGVGVGVQEASVVLQLAGLAIFAFKTLLMAFVVIWLRWTLPRFRVDQLMNLCWKYFVPVGFVVFVGAAMWELLPPSALSSGRWIMFAIGILVFVVFVNRVRYHMQLTGARVAFNPLKLMFQDGVPEGDHVPFAVASLYDRAQGLPGTAWIERRPPAPAVPAAVPPDPASPAPTGGE
ncbi:MAG: NADH-quinone oxidoreductase subunit NuoH [Deltaproteobacteria bacterium]|nr:NADH-quinone oxidoreductase subunit NuoH [Deltaproteobacteria bacterium]